MCMFKKIVQNIENFIENWIYKVNGRFWNNLEMKQLRDEFTNYQRVLVN